MADLSIIIPAYNAEKTLTRTVESIQASTLRDLEIWIVDDGSTDGTLALSETFSQGDARIHVIHQENKGCYMARLAALRQIRTPYFAFVDADDTICAQMYERLLKIMTEHNLDIVECDAVGAGRNDGTLTIFENEKECYEKCVYPRLVKGEGAVFVWDKIYRNRFDFSTFDEIPVLMFEDMIFNLQFFKTCKRFGHLNEDLYFYDVNVGSSVRNYRDKSLFDFLATINYRGKVIPRWYAASLTETDLDAWTIMNARNLFISASNAPASSWQQRFKHLCTIANAFEVKVAIQRLKITKSRIKFLPVVTYAMNHPVLLGTICFFLKRIQRLVRNR